MNFIDVLLLLPIAWLAYKGFKRGLIIELATLIALLLGIYLAGKLSVFTADFLRQKMDFHSEYMGIISFTLSFIGIVVLVILFGKSIEQIAKITLLGTANRIAGAIFGILKGIFGVSIFIFILTSFKIEEKVFSSKLQSESLLYQPIKTVAPALFPVIEESKHDWLDAISKITDSNQ